MNTDGAAGSLGKGREIAERLRLLERAEGVRLARNFQVDEVFIGQLNKDAFIRAAFVKLARRMKVSRAVACGRRRVIAVSEVCANRLQQLVMRARFLNVGKQ